MKYHFKASGSNDIISEYWGESSGSSDNLRVRDYACPTTEVVSLAPLVIDDRFTSHALVVYAAPGGELYSTPFTMNGMRYIPLAGNLVIAMD